MVTNCIDLGIAFNKADGRACLENYGHVPKTPPERFRSGRKCFRFDPSGADRHGAEPRGRIRAKSGG